MAVEVTNSRESFVGTGALANYAPGIYAQTADQIVVTVNGVVTNAYAVTGLRNPGGVTVSGTFAFGSNVKIQRKTTKKQHVDTLNNQTILEDVFDDALDKSMMIDQELDDTANDAESRSLRVPEGESIAAFPAAADRVLRAPRFNADGYGPDLLNSSAWVAWISGDILSLIGNVAKGDPGGTTMSIGLFTVAPTLAIPVGSDLVQTSGYSISGIGMARYIYDAAVDVAYVAAHPRSSFRSSNGRGFRLIEPVLWPEMFGAIGNGVAIDWPALLALSDFVNAADGGIVEFAAGATYLGGTQTLNPAPHTLASTYAFPPDVTYPLYFLNCTRGVVLRGSGARIKCLDGALYGTFNDDMTPYGSVAPYFGGRIATPYYSMLMVEGCSGAVHIENIEFDGNIANAIIGGQFGDVGRQIPMTGYTFKNNTGPINTRNIVTHHHGLDGGIGDGPGLLNAREMVRIHGRHYNNGRQGFSLVGGNGWHFEDGCEFYGSGKNIGALTYSPPGAGIDLEAEGGKYVANVTFGDFISYGNIGVAFLSDTNAFVRNVRVYGGRLVGSDSWAAWPANQGMRFYGTTFVGPIVNLHPDADADKAGQLIGCTITDDVALSPTGTVFLQGGSNTIIDGGAGSQNVLLDRLTIRLTNAARTLPFGTFIIRSADWSLTTAIAGETGGEFHGINRITGAWDNTPIFYSHMFGEVFFNGNNIRVVSAVVDFGTIAAGATFFYAAPDSFANDQDYRIAWLDPVPEGCVVDVSRHPDTFVWVLVTNRTGAPIVVGNRTVHVKRVQFYLTP